MILLDEIKKMIGSFGGYQIEFSRSFEELAQFFITIKITNEIVREKTIFQPSGGDLFLIFFPRRFKSTLKAVKHLSKTNPCESVRRIKDEWLSKPVMAGHEVLLSSVLAYKPITTRIRDGEEQKPCFSCSGKGMKMQTAHEAGLYGDYKYVYATCRSCNGNGFFEVARYRHQKGYLTYRIKTSITACGQEKASVFIKKLRKKIAGGILSSDFILENCLPQRADDFGLREKPEKILINYSVRLPISEYKVVLGRETVCSLYVFEGFEDPLIISRNSFLEKHMREKIAAIAGMTRETLSVAAENDPFLSMLLIDVNNDNIEATMSNFAWLVKRRTLNKAMNKARRVMGKKKMGPSWWSFIKTFLFRKKPPKKLDKVTSFPDKSKQENAQEMNSREVKRCETNSIQHDYAQAAEAAERDDPVAQCFLGSVYYLGKGVPKDYALAYMWVNLAAAQGLEKAIKLRDEYAKTLTPSQIEEGQRLAREWLAAHQQAGVE